MFCYLTCMTRFAGKLRAGWSAGRHLTALCVCTLCLSAGISGLVGLMPLYLTRLGADAAATGRFLAFVYLCLAASTIAAGKLAHWSRRRKLWLVVGGLRGRAAQLGDERRLQHRRLAHPDGLFVAGHRAPDHHGQHPGWPVLNARPARRRFGALTLSSGSGLMLGSLVSGPLVDRWGFSGLFTAFGWSYLLIPVAGFLVDDPPVLATQSTDERIGASDPEAARLRGLVDGERHCAGGQHYPVSQSGPDHGRPRVRRHHDQRRKRRRKRAHAYRCPWCLAGLPTGSSRKPLMLACFAAPVLGLVVQIIGRRSMAILAGERTQHRRRSQYRRRFGAR